MVCEQFGSWAFHKTDSACSTTVQAATLVARRLAPPRVQRGHDASQWQRQTNVSGQPILKLFSQTAFLLIYFIQLVTGVSGRQIVVWINL